MLKKLLIVTISVLFVAAACSKGGGKYSDIKAVMGDLIKAEEIFIASADKAKAADDIVKATNTLSDTMAKLKPKMTDLEKKYPELKDEKNVPVELKETMDKVTDINAKFTQNMQTIMTKWGNEPTVQKAFQDLMVKNQ